MQTRSIAGEGLFGSTLQMIHRSENYQIDFGRDWWTHRHLIVPQTQQWLQPG